MRLVYCLRAGLRMGQLAGLVLGLVVGLMTGQALAQQPAAPRYSLGQPSFDEIPADAIPPAPAPHKRQPPKPAPVAKSPEIGRAHV